MVVAKFYKLMINITSVNLDKTWDYKNLTFNIISTIKYSIKILCEFRFCYVLIKMRIFPIYFFIDVLQNAYHLLKLIIKIYETYNNAYYIQTLPDYHIYTDLKNQGLITPNLTKEEIEKLKKEKMNLCNICLCEIEKGKYLNCGHVFHLKCIKEWVSINSKCPICKSSVINPNYNRNKFFNERFGINNNANINNNNLNNNIEQQPGNDMNEENIGLHKVKTNGFGSNKSSDYTDNANNLLEKFLRYKKFKEKIDELKDRIGQDINTNKNKCKSGAISYGMPTEAIYDRNIDNELKRLEIELVNQKFLRIYEEPKNSLMEINQLNIK